MQSGGLPGSAHSDVLLAKPETDEEKEGLVAEIKERAKKAFGLKQMPVCEALYSKAIEVKAEAASYANRSAVRLIMGRHADARVDAEAAAAADATYSKAYYRLGQACEKLEKFEDALRAYEEGQKLEPASKLWLGLLEKAKKAKEEFDARPPPPDEPEQPVIERYEISARLKASLDASSASKKTTSASELRGYKLDSQGRRTT